MAQSLDGDSKAKLSAHRTKIGRKTIWKTAQDMERELVMRVLSRKGSFDSGVRLSSGSFD